MGEQDLDRFVGIQAPLFRQAPERRFNDRRDPRTLDFFNAEEAQHRPSP
ncbi:MAG TPA: hypothetical protein VF503_05725 [Sphingobium sp.]